MAMSKKYTVELLGPIVARSTSLAQVLRELGLKPSGGNYAHIGRTIDACGIDRSHFFGKAGNRGGRHRGGPSRKVWQALLVKREEGRRQKSFKLRRALIEMGRPYRCEGPGCGVEGQWLGRPMILHVDHLNGDWLDDRPENLSFLCPNCHSQTSNWCGTKGLSDVTHRRRAFRSERLERARRRGPCGGMADASVLGTDVREDVGVRLSPGPLFDECPPE
jgi:hypothetical protein